MGKLTRLFALSIALLAVQPAAAYEFIADCRGGVRWNNNDVLWRPSLVSFPLGSTWYADVDAVRVAWNSYTPGGNYRISYSWDTNTSLSNTDGRNSIVMPAPAQWIWGNALGITLPRRSKCYVWPGPDADWVEMDTAFNPDPNPSWETATNPIPKQFAPTNFTLIALHEHGHGMGLEHENDGLATMNQYYPSGGPIGTRNDVHPHADDARGDRALYGTAATLRDVAAFAYHVHPYAPGLSEVIPPPASANRNAAVSFQFTIENRGTVNLSAVPVYFYLSSTRNVTTSDIFLGSASFNLNSGATITPTAYVTIPAWAPTGNQYLGWIIDPYNSIVESDEGNNAVALWAPTLINANRAPAACMTANPTYGSAPLLVSFDASCSSDPDGEALTYSWDFGDGNIGYGPQVDNWYETSGFYTVTLTVTDPNGLSAVTQQQISVTCAGSFRCAEEPL